jgi:hypothetical protein
MLFKNFGKPPKPNLTRMIRTADGRLMSVQAHAEIKRREALAKQAKMPTQEEYDLTYRGPMSSTKALGYDFSQ